MSCCDQLNTVRCDKKIKNSLIYSKSHRNTQCFIFEILYVFCLLSHILFYWKPFLKTYLEPISIKNGSVDFLQGTLGHSYVCRVEQTWTVSQNFSINTFQVQVQPFGVTGNQFGAGKSIRWAVERLSAAFFLRLKPSCRSVPPCSRGMPAGRRQPVDPHHSRSSFSRPGPHRALGLPDWQEEEPRRLPNDLRSPVWCQSPEHAISPLKLN